MKIEIHGWVQDNTGSYHRKGSTLTVDADGGAGCISAKRADALVKANGAMRVAPRKPPTAAD